MALYSMFVDYTQYTIVYNVNIGKAWYKLVYISAIQYILNAMGRRKSKRKPPSKKKAIQPLDTQFNCPFCNHEKSCEVKMYL